MTTSARLAWRVFFYAVIGPFGLRRRCAAYDARLYSSADAHQNSVHYNCRFWHKMFRAQSWADRLRSASIASGWRHLVIVNCIDCGLHTLMSDLIAVAMNSDRVLE